MVTKNKGGRPRVIITESKAIGAVFVQILKGTNTVTKIAKELNKKHPTICEQMRLLEKDGWVKKDKGVYIANKKMLLDYTVSTYKTDRKKLEHLFDELIENIFSLSEEIPIKAVALALNLMVKSF